MLRNRRATTVALAALTSLLMVFAAMPAFASAAAAEYEVDVTGDGGETSGCETPGVGTECTLRGAIFAANANAGADKIKFDPTVFQGAAPAASITLGSALPPITEAVEIDAGRCLTGWNPVEGPCAQVTGLESSALGGNSLTVEAAGVTIRGLAIDGGTNGIAVTGGGDQFTAVDDWFGVGLNRGEGTANFAAGIRLEAGADEALIGGLVGTQRNVFSSGRVGAYLDGASFATIEGNWFGLKPDGTYQASKSLTQAGVRVVDKVTPATKAAGNEIGGQLTSPEATSAECDGPCNVFATNGGRAIDLAGSSGEGVRPASGPTTIRANYLGLDPAGSAAIGGSLRGVYAGPAGPAGGPAEVTIGGTTPATEGNFFVGGEYGVEAIEADELEVLGNLFGWSFAHAPLDPPVKAGIKVDSRGLTEGAYVSMNRLNAERRTGIESLYTGSEIFGNEIVDAAFGIVTTEADGGVGNLIGGNTLTEPEVIGVRVENDANVLNGNTISKAEQIGIEIEGEFPTPFTEGNRVTANTIDAAGATAIFVGSNATHSRIGGDALGEGNVILNSGLASAPPEAKARFGAITISSRQEGRTEVAGNSGSGNYGAFIKLFSHGGSEEPNGGVKPPVLSTVHQSSAAGTAAAGATVRVFSKAAPEAGELGALLAVVKADGAGNWSATYATLATGTLVTATQTSTTGGTSELAAPAAAGADPPKPVGPAVVNPAPVTTPITTPAPPKAPTVKITSGPKKSSTATTAKFKFKASVSGAKLECKLDGAKWAKCSSPKTYRKLKPGKHTFRVKAKVGGLTSAVAKFEFTVKS